MNTARNKLPVTDDTIFHLRRIRAGVSRNIFTCPQSSINSYKMNAWLQLVACNRALQAENSERDTDDLLEVSRPAGLAAHYIGFSQRLAQIVTPHQHFLQRPQIFKCHT